MGPSLSNSAAPVTPWKIQVLQVFVAGRAANNQHAGYAQSLHCVARRYKLFSFEVDGNNWAPIGQ